MQWRGEGLDFTQQNIELGFQNIALYLKPGFNILQSQNNKYHQSLV